MTNDQGKGNVLTMDDWFLKAHRTVITSVMALIADYGYQSLEEVPQEDKCLLASALLEDDKEFYAEQDFITASPNFDHIIYLFQKFLCGNKQAGSSFIEHLKESAVHYYVPLMQEIFAYCRARFENEYDEWIKERKRP